MRRLFWASIGILFLLLQLALENWLLHDYVGIPEQDLALVPFIHGLISATTWSTERKYPPRAVTIVVMNRQSDGITKRCSTREAVRQLLDKAQHARAVVLDMAFDPTEDCGGETDKLKTAITSLCDSNAVPVVIGASSTEPSLRFEGHQNCVNASMQVSQDLRRIPLTFGNGQSSEDGLALALAKVAVPITSLQARSNDFFGYPATRCCFWSLRSILPIQEVLRCACRPAI